MAELGSYYITIMPSMKGFTSEINSQLGGLGTKGGSKFSGGFLDVLKGSAIGTTLGNLATKAGSSIMDGLSVGIGRLDTIENFPRVMEALGYSTDEADKSINTIMEHLDGLPTATQDMVTLTQAISDSTGDLDLATRAALGFNDMMLANGASAAEVATAQGVLNRVLGKGSATAAQWQSLTSVMPAQLGIVAKQMLGAGASTEDLHSALEDGTVSWNDFLQAIADLDKSGYVDEAGRQIASFEEQARANSDGIGTAIDNIKNRIGAGWADILKAIGRSDISSTINTMSYGVRDGMRKIAEAITYVKDAIGKTNIGENLGKIGSAIGDFLGKIGQGAAPVLKDFADKMVDFIDKALQWVVDHGDLVQSLLVGIGSALALKEAMGVAKVLNGAVDGFGALGQALSAADGLKDLPTVFALASETGGPLAGVFKSLGGAAAGFLTNPWMLGVLGITAVVGGLTYFFTQTERGQEIWQGFCDTLGALWEGLQQDFQNLVETIKQRMDESSAQWEVFKNNVGNVIRGITGFFSNLKKDFDNMVARIKQNLADNTVQWNVFKTNVGNVIQGIVNFFSNLKRDFDNMISRIKQNLSDNAAQWETFKANVGRSIDNVKTAALNAFDNIKNGIRDKIQWAHDQVRGIIDRIKGLFNFSWSLPAPKLPHINWHWSSIGGLLSLPVFDGISWYAKGAIFNKATIAGLGEAGKEAALPLNKRSYGEIARGIANELGTGSGTGVTVTGNTFVIREEADIDRIAEALDRKIRRERMAMA